MIGPSIMPVLNASRHLPMSGRRCLLCGRNDSWYTVLDRVRDLRFGVEGEREYRRCGGCGLVVLHPWPEDHQAGYPSPYSQHRQGEVFGSGRTPLRRFLRREVLRSKGYGAGGRGRRGSGAGWLFGRIPPVRVAAQGGLLLLPDAKPGGRLLDYGCGNGRFLATMAHLGWVAYGIERDIRSADLARSTDSRVTVLGDLGEADFPPGHFDLITMNHVIEHLDDPVAVLLELRRLLAPDGYIAIACPNWSALSRRAWGRAWYALEAPRHTVHFEPATLRKALESAGFVVASLKTPSIRESAECWSKSWLYRYRRPAPKAVVTAGMALSCVASLVRAGDEIEAWARPGPAR